MAYAVRIDVQSPAAAGVVRTSRRAHLMVVSAPAVQRRERPAPEVFRRRRLVVSALVAVTTLMSTMMVASWADRSVGAPFGSPAAASSLAGHWMAPDVDGTLRYVVAAGDSLWAVAHHVTGGRDTRAVAERLIAELGGARLVPGQVVEIRP